jgi:hypothetical protein
MPENKVPITYATEDEKLYIALKKKVIEEKEQGLKTTLKSLVERLLWRGLNDK